MKRFFIFITLIFACLSLISFNAEAKRFGGGSSIGKQRSMAPEHTQKAPAAAPAPSTPAQQPAAAPQSKGNKWLGPLAGLAIGAGLGALFASMGLGQGMGTILMIILGALAVFFIISLFRKKSSPQPAMQYAGAGAPYSAPAAEPVQQPVAGSIAATTSAATVNIPADFPVEAFLRSAKTSFIRLQAANDRKDLNDIREYTTPEMYAEISMQLQERDNTPQKTDVISVNATLLEVVTENNLAIASVRLTGELSENGGAPEHFDEIWHVQKNLQDDKAVWLMAGIQQV